MPQRPLPQEQPRRPLTPRPKSRPRPGFLPKAEFERRINLIWRDALAARREGMGTKAGLARYWPYFLAMQKAIRLARPKRLRAAADAAYLQVIAAEIAYESVQLGKGLRNAPAQNYLRAKIGLLKRIARRHPAEAPIYLGGARGLQAELERMARAPATRYHVEVSIKEVQKVYEHSLNQLKATIGRDAFKFFLAARSVYIGVVS